MKRLLFSSLLIFSFFILPISVNADSNGLAGYWKFDEGSGASASDSSGNGLTGAVSGATWVDGISGKALNFSGVNDYFSMPSNSKLTFSNGNFTADLWFKLPQSYSGGGKMKWLLLKNGEYGLVLDTDGKLKFYISSNSGGYMSSVKNNWNANTWYHVVGVFENGNTWKIYINGNLDNSGSATYKTDRTDCSFDVGNFLGCQTAHDNFMGTIDEVKIYSRPLSASEILAEYKSFPTSSSSNSTTTTTPSTSSSWCTNWVNAGCGISPCSSDKMKQTQKCGYSNSSGYSSEWENSQCVANETCSPIICTMDVKQCSDGSYVSRNPNANCEFYSCPTITPTPTNCIGAALDIISSRATASSFQVAVQNVGQINLSNFTITAKMNDNSLYRNTNTAAALSIPSGSSSVITLPDITSAKGCPLSMLRISINCGNSIVSVEMDNTTKSICEGQSSSSSNPFFLNVCSGWAQTGCNKNNYNSSIEQAFKIWQPNMDLNNLPNGQNKIDYLANKCGCSGSSSFSGSFSTAPIKEVDKTVLLDVLFGLEQVKIKLDGLKDSALAISEYYSGKGDAAKAGKWLEISSTFNGVINNMNGITAEIKQNKDNITADFVQKIKGEVGGVKAEISSVIDKILEVM